MQWKGADERGTVEAEENGERRNVKMKRLSKRIISSVLTGTMLLSLLGGSALAVEPEGARKRK